MNGNSLTISGIPVTIEIPAGGVRTGVSAAGVEWSRTIPHAYGFIGIGTSGDDEAVDCYVAADMEPSESAGVYIVNQCDRDGAFDEHKVMLGFESIEAAEAGYRANYPDDWTGLGGIVEMPLTDFQVWLMQGDKSQPAGEGTPSRGPGADADPDEPAGEGTPSRGPGADADPDEPANDELSDVLVAGGEWELLSDANGAVKVRQLATVADAVNGNRRVYPRAVLDEAIARANENAHAGAMLMEYVHPEPVKTSKGPAYADNPDRKTARIDHITPVQADGRVFVEHTTLATAMGREMAARYRSKRAPGISTRFKMRSHTARMDGIEVLVADSMEISTWDHVDNPAVPETSSQYQLLTDSQRDQLGSPFAVVADPGVAAPGPAGSRAFANASEGRSRMTDKFKRSLNRGYSLVAQRAPAAELAQVRKTAADCIAEAELAGDDVVEATNSLLALDEAMRVAGYNSDRPGPEAIPGNNTGTGNGPGYAPDANRETTAESGTGTGATDGLTAEEREAFRAHIKATQSAAADAQRKAGIKAAVDSARTHSGLAKLTPEEQDFLLSQVEATASDAAGVPGLVEMVVDNYGKLAAKHRLAGMGLPVNGSTVADPATPTRPFRGAAVVTREAVPYMVHTDAMLAAADDFARTQQGDINPDSSVQKSIRKHNRDNFIDPVLVNRLVTGVKGHGSVAAWFAAEDSLISHGEQVFNDSVLGPAATHFDAITTGNLLNQPSIMLALLIQAFQDLVALPFCQGLGPGIANAGETGWFNTGGRDKPGQVGTVLKIPVETYLYGSGYAAKPARNFNPGMAFAEGAGITTISNDINWLSFVPVIRRLAAEVTKDVTLSMGNGPLNYNAWGRIMYWMGVHKSQVMDLLMLNDITNTADEFGCVPVTAETANLTNNSSYLAGGSVKVNLNPSKAASATIASTDPFVAYGANVLGAIRFQCAGGGSAAPYCGNEARTGLSPLAAGTLQPNAVRPRVVTSVDGSGNISTSTNNPIAFSTPSSGTVLGYLDDTGNIANMPGTTANYAVDHENGVVIFMSTFPSLAGSAGVISAPAVALATYSYSTNYDAFQVNNVSLPTGVTYSGYIDALLVQMSTTAAFMGSSGRYVKPDTALMSLQAATKITQARIFHNLESPRGSELYPTEQFFANRDGILMARHNAPWQVGDMRFPMFRSGSTKYGVETPWETEGPFPKYDSNQNLVDNKIFMGREKSTVCTPQVTDGNGNVLNPVSRMVRLY